VDLYRKAVAEVGEVWPGARLATVDREEIPCRPRARVWLPSEPNSTLEVLGLIRASNPDLPTNNWKIVKQEEAKGGFKLAIMVLNRESLAPLAKTNGVINFGFGSITLKVYKKDEGEGNDGQPDNAPPQRAEELGSLLMEEAPKMELQIDETSSLISLGSDEEYLSGPLGEGKASLEETGATGSATDTAGDTLSTRS
jgi:hypothetical protein